MFPSGRRTFALITSMVAITLAIFAALFPVTSDQIKINEGEIATRTVRAPRDISFISQTLTEERQDEAAAAVEPKPVFDPSVAGNQQSKLNELLSRVRTIISDEPTPVARAAALQRLSERRASPRAACCCCKTSP